MKNPKDIFSEAAAEVALDAMKSDKNPNLRVMHSSAKDDWETPPEFFQAMEKLFGKFDLDAACTPKNKKTAIGIEYPVRDALQLEWIKFGVRQIWLNPPYKGFVIKGEAVVTYLPK